MTRCRYENSINRPQRTTLATCIDFVSVYAAALLVMFIRVHPQLNLLLSDRVRLLARHLPPVFAGAVPEPHAPYLTGHSSTLH